MVFLQSISRPRGPSGACLSAVKDGKARLFLCDRIIAEVSNVLNRLTFRDQFPALTDEAITEFLGEIVVDSARIADIPSHFRLPRDGKDEKYLDLAIECGAEYLISRDRDLLDLMTD